MAREKSDDEVLTDVLEEESGGKDYTITTKHGEITFQLERVSRVRRHEFVDSLPDALVEHMQEQADEKRESVDVNDISNLDDLSRAEPEDAPSGATLTADAVREMEDLIVEALTHPTLVESEIRDFLEMWPDEQFYATAFLILAISGEASGVEDFRIDQ